jgi:hypothetical protein
VTWSTQAKYDAEIVNRRGAMHDESAKAAKMTLKNELGRIADKLVEILASSRSTGTS